MRVWLSLSTTPAGVWPHCGEYSSPPTHRSTRPPPQDMEACGALAAPSQPGLPCVNHLVKRRSPRRRHRRSTWPCTTARPTASPCRLDTDEPRTPPLPLEEGLERRAPYPNHALPSLASLPSSLLLVTLQLLPRTPPARVLALVRLELGGTPRLDVRARRDALARVPLDDLGSQRLSPRAATPRPLTSACELLSVGLILSISHTILIFLPLRRVSACSCSCSCACSWLPDRADSQHTPNAHSQQAGVEVLHVQRDRHA